MGSVGTVQNISARYEDKDFTCKIAPNGNSVINPLSGKVQQNLIVSCYSSTDGVTNQFSDALGLVSSGAFFSRLKITGNENYKATLTNNSGSVTASFNLTQKTLITTPATPECPEPTAISSSN